MGGVGKKEGTQDPCDCAQLRIIGEEGGTVSLRPLLVLEDKKFLEETNFSEGFLLMMWLSMVVAFATMSILDLIV